MPPSGEQTRLYVLVCPECQNNSMLTRAERMSGGARCAWDHPERDMERIDVVPASDLAALQAERDEARNLAEEAWEWVAVALDAAGWPTVFDIPDWQERSKHLDPSENKGRISALQSDLRIAREALERLCDFAGEMESHHGIEEVAGPTQPPTEWDQMQRDLAHEVEAARTALQQLEAGQGDG